MRVGNTAVLHGQRCSLNPYCTAICVRRQVYARATQVNTTQDERSAVLHLECARQVLTIDDRALLAARKREIQPAHDDFSPSREDDSTRRQIKVQVFPIALLNGVSEIIDALHGYEAWRHWRQRHGWWKRRMLRKGGRRRRIEWTLRRKEWIRRG